MCAVEYCMESEAHEKCAKSVETSKDTKIITSE